MTSAKDLLRTALSTRWRSSHSCVLWQVRSPEWKNVAEQVEHLVESPDHIPSSALLKRAPRRLVFQLDAPVPERLGIVVKVFPLPRLRDRFKHRKYGYNETIHLLAAANLGLPVPKVFGYGRCQRMGLVCWNAVFMEFIKGRPLKEHLAKAADLAKRELLWRVLPLFQKLFETGCNHIDVGPHAILLGEADHGDCLIDLQYCRFLDKPSPATLAAQAGYFGWCLTTHWNLVPQELIFEWFQAILSRLSLQNRPDLEKIFQHHLAHKASIRERLEN